MTRRLTSGRVVIATHNSGKLIEMRMLLAPFCLDAVSAGELGLPEPEETGASFRENATLKACAAARESGLPALADDSGLVVDALDGAPGVHTARWAGPDRDWDFAMETVDRRLREKGAVTPAQRRARFVSALSLAWPDGHTEEFEGTVEGTLVWPPRGRKGFGYDPMFLPDGFARTFGEMTGEEKHGWLPGMAPLSHRARAFAALAAACFEKVRA